MSTIHSLKLFRFQCIILSHTHTHTHMVDIFVYWSILSFSTTTSINSCSFVSSSYHRVTEVSCSHYTPKNKIIITDCDIKRWRLIKTRQDTVFECTISVHFNWPMPFTYTLNSKRLWTVQWCILSPFFFMYTSMMINWLIAMRAVTKWNNLMNVRDTFWASPHLTTFHFPWWCG